MARDDGRDDEVLDLLGHGDDHPDDDQLGDADAGRASRRRGRVVVGGVLAVVAVGLVAAAATAAGGTEHRDATPPPPPAGTQVSTPARAATEATEAAEASEAAAARTGPAVVASAELTASHLQRPASLAVDLTPVTPGIDALGGVAGLVDRCRLSPDTTEYATVGVVFTDRGGLTKAEGNSANLRADLTVVGSSGAGVFVESRDADGVCETGTSLPARTTLQSQDVAGEHQRMTVYVVARTSPGQPDPLHGVTLQVSGLRRNPDDISAEPWSWHLDRLTAGSACPDDPQSLCVPLG